MFGFYNGLDERDYGRFMVSIDTKHVDYIISRYVPDDLVNIITLYRISPPKYLVIGVFDNCILSLYAFLKYTDTQGDYLYMEVCGKHSNVMIYLEDIMERIDMNRIHQLADVRYVVPNYSYRGLVRHRRKIMKSLEPIIKAITIAT